MKNAQNRIKFIALITCAGLALTACGSIERLGSVGAAPNQSTIQSPTQKPGYQPVSMPMPAPKSEERLANSLWSGGSRKTFFEDQRADNIGDILTVTIDINDEANLKNETTRKRDASEETAAPAALGFEGYLGKVLPDGVDPASLLDITTASNNKGTGEIKRAEDVKLKVAAIVSQILPNGNLVIQGHQEVLVNYENRVLEMSGIIRPEDINIDNTISYEKVAEARISYGGKGQLTDVQQARYGQQVLDIISPF
jgi:flagellar L-ring protein precursor FlgH